MTRRTRYTLICLFFTLLGVSLGFLAFAYRKIETCTEFTGELSTPHSTVPDYLLPLTAALLLVCVTLIFASFYFFLSSLDEKRQSDDQTARSLRLALKSGRFGIWDWDILHNILVWDDRMYEIYGCSRSGFKGCLEAWKNGLHPGDKVMALAATGAALRGEKDYDMSFRIVRPDGEIRYIKAEGSVIRGADGAAVRMLGLNSDVTEQKMILDSIIRERNNAQLYLDIAGVMFTAIDDSGDIIMINKKGCEILGYKESELLGRNWFELCLPAGVVDVVKEVFAKQMAGEIESVKFFENAIRTCSGEERVIAFHNTLLRNDAEAICGVLFSGEDITERKKAEALLEKAASEWKAAMDASNDAIYLLDLNRKLLRANKAFFIMTGRTPANSIDLPITEIVHPGHPGPCSLCDAEEALCDYVTVLEADHPDNHQGRPVEVSIKMVRDGDRNPVSILVTRHDLSFDRKTQEALRESEERYRQLVELSQDIIFIKSAGKIVFMNDAGLNMLGAASPEQVISKAMLDFVHPDSKALVENHMEAVGKLGKLPVIEVKYLRLDGGTFFGEETATLIMHQGKPAIHVFVRDITKRKSLEEQLRHSQKLEAVGHLAGGIAHDFNNILTVIGGYGSLLEMKMQPDDPKKEMVAQILAATERAANLTGSLLAFSRKQEMHAADSSLNEIVQNVGKFLRRIIGEDISFSTKLVPEPLVVRVDKGQIEQVIINLATNARDAMEKGGVFAVATGRMEFDEQFIQSHGYGVPGKYAVISVSDDGEGMDDAVRRKIFEPFFTTKEVGKGTGLGLSIVYGIVKQHKGYIEVKSGPGQGTNFNIYLPLSHNQHLERKSEDALENLQGGSETILVAEDEAHVRELVDSVLKELGYRTILALDGQDALDKFLLHRESIKLIFTDLIMPRKSGKELYDEVKAVEPGMKVLFTSGYMADVLQKQGKLDGQFDVLLKPASPMQLAGKIREMLDA